MCSISVPFSFLDWLSCTRSNIAKDRFLDIVVFIFAGSIDTSISAMQHVAMFSIVCNQIQDVQQTERAVMHSKEYCRTLFSKFMDTSFIAICSSSLFGRTRFGSWARTTLHWCTVR